MLCWEYGIDIKPQSAQKTMWISVAEPFYRRETAGKEKWLMYQELLGNYQGKYKIKSRELSMADIRKILNG